MLKNKSAYSPALQMNKTKKGPSLQRKWAHARIFGEYFTCRMLKIAEVMSSTADYSISRLVKFCSQCDRIAFMFPSNAA